MLFVCLMWLPGDCRGSLHVCFQGTPDAAWESAGVIQVNGPTTAGARVAVARGEKGGVFRVRGVGVGSGLG